MVAGLIFDNLLCQKTKCIIAEYIFLLLCKFNTDFFISSSTNITKKVHAKHDVHGFLYILLTPYFAYARI